MKLLVTVAFATLTLTLIHKCFAKQTLSVRELEELEELERVLAERKSEDLKEKVKSACDIGEKKLIRLAEKQQELKMKGIDGTKKKGRKNRLTVPSEESIARQEAGTLFLEITKVLVESTGKTPEELATDVDVSSALNDCTSGGSETRRKRQTQVPCATTVDCSTITDVNQYRTLDGTCNNKNNPLWGSAFSTQPRFETMKAVYDNKVDSPRKSVVGSDLPNARNLSNEFFSTPDGTTAAEAFNTLMSMNWGQFLDHDLVATPTMSGADGSDITCCSVPRTECMDISLNWDPTKPDPHFTTTCMEFVRSAPAPVCGISAKQVTNQITSFIDASQVYGNSKAQSDALRAIRGGQLSAFLDTKLGLSNRELLPEDPSKDAICSLSGNDPGDYCQKAGDARVNVQPGLGGLHLVFVREHNRIVSKLAAVQPTWSQDKLFNEARKIVGAIVQHITFDETSGYFGNVFAAIAPATVSPVTGIYGLVLSTSGYYDGYDQTVDPSIRVGFATAGFRFGHSQIPGSLAYMADDYNTTTSQTNMVELFKNPHMLIFQAGAKIADLVRYMSSTTARNVDRQFESSVRDNLFGEYDLPALNIQRGRDNGLPSYVAWRRFCGLSTPANGQDWLGLTDINKQIIKIFQTNRIYADVNDIDLYVGGMLENRFTQYLGPTFACILGKQFQALRKGDRFWYERPLPEGFTPDQLTEIRKNTLSLVLCNNADITSVQRNAFKREAGTSLTDKKVPCTDYAKQQMDFTKWA